LLHPSVIVVVAYGQIIPSEIIHLPEYGCINVHASLLPKYRGAAPVNWAIINGEKNTGVTIMLMDEEMDTGPVLLQEETEIKAADTAGSLFDRLSEMGADLLLRALQGVERGSLLPRTQADEATYAPLMKKTDGVIQWSKTAESLSYFVRGMNPWPGAFSFLEGERIRILKVSPITSDRVEAAEGTSKKEDAGVIETVSRDELTVRTGDGRISILELQPSGKPAMTIRSFLQGRKLRGGMRFQDR
jgi:methionyl-tRNA formyltransferase